MIPSVFNYYANNKIKTDKYFFVKDNSELENLEKPLSLKGKNCMRKEYVFFII